MSEFIKPNLSVIAKLFQAAQKQKSGDNPF